MPSLLRRTSLKMLFVLTKYVTCLVTLVLIKVTVFLLAGNWDECLIFIHVRELIVDYGVKKLIRVGTAGSFE